MVFPVRTIPGSESANSNNHRQYATALRASAGRLTLCAPAVGVRALGYESILSSIDIAHFTFFFICRYSSN